MFRARIVRGIVLAGMVSGAMSVGGVAAADDGRATAVDARVSVASPEPESAVFGGLAAWLPPELRPPEPERLVDLLGSLVDLGPLVEWIGPWQAPPKVGPPPAGPAVDVEARAGEPGAGFAPGPATAIVPSAPESDVEAKPLAIRKVESPAPRFGEGPLVAPPVDEPIDTAPSSAYDSLHHAFLGFAVAAMVIAFALVASTVLTGTVPAAGRRRGVANHGTDRNRAHVPTARPQIQRQAKPHRELGRPPDRVVAPGDRPAPDLDVRVPSPERPARAPVDASAAAERGRESARAVAVALGSGLERDPGDPAISPPVNADAGLDLHARNAFQRQQHCRCGRSPGAGSDHLVGARAGPRRSTGIGNANAPPGPGSEPVESAPVESTVEPAIGGAAPVT